MSAIRMPVKTKKAPLKPKEPEQMQGLGDLVAAVAEPIKKSLPQGIRKYLSNCGCEKRQEWLNKLIPFKAKEAT
jgi:hypothetical protein